MWFYFCYVMVDGGLVWSGGSFHLGESPEIGN